MGANHFGYENTPVVAICDVDKKHLAQAAGMLKNKVKTFHDYQKLIELSKWILCISPPHPIAMVL
ncbi:hypothetical protein GCM10027566_06360 [Arachidicoccus ginsenosidivorans]|uniref:hypothetical protein n=1 Tax=Arachidicoccus ginsenosidivorans TaxID=496057 RepID=UPI001CEF7EFF|nr:hypothetical protein [Arachidicoccus ginsenosidivorans]